MYLAYPLAPRGNAMTSHVKPIPEGYHTITPVLMVNDAAKLIDFLKDAFGAREKERFTDPSGKIVHAEVTLGDSIVQFSDATGEWKPVKVPLLFVRDGHRRDLSTGPRSRCDLPPGAHRRVLRRPERGRQGRVRQLVMDRHPPGRRVPRGTRQACRSRDEKVGPLADA